jgi:hypothetical protein
MDQQIIKSPVFAVAGKIRGYYGDWMVKVINILTKGRVLGELYAEVTANATLSNPLTGTEIFSEDKKTLIS